MHTSAFISVSIYINILKIMNSCWYLQYQSIQDPGFILVFSFFFFVTLLSNCEKPRSHYLQHALLICAILIYTKSSFRIANPYCYKQKKVQTHIQYLYTVLWLYRYCFPNFLILVIFFSAPIILFLNYIFWYLTINIYYCLWLCVFKDYILWGLHTSWRIIAWAK